MSRFGTIGTQYFDSSGDPLASGLLYFYGSGTTTLKNTYADINLTVANANPVELTADGRQPNIFYDGTAKVILTDSTYVQIEQKDPIGGDAGAQLGDWSITAIYGQFDFVTGSDGCVYKSTASGNQGNDPTVDDGSNWAKIKQTTLWKSTITFAAKDIAQGSDGFLYVSVTSSNLNNDPVTDDGTNWAPVSNTYTVGDVVISGDSTKYAPPSWLECNGDAYSSTTYADLYAELGGYPTKLADPSTLPASNGGGASWSSDNTYLAVSNSGAPVLTIYKRSGDTFTKLADPATLPTGTSQNNSVSFDSTDVYLSVAHATTPYVTIYKRAADVFTKLANPATLPTGLGQASSFSPDSNYLAVAHSTSPYITIYSRSGDTFTKVTNPATLPTGGAVSCAWDATSTFLAVGHATSPFLTIYEDIAGTFTKVANPATLPANQVNGLTFNVAGDTLIVSGFAAPYLAAYSLSGSTFTKIDDYPAGNATSYGVAISKADDRLIQLNGSATYDYMEQYQVDGGNVTQMDDFETLPAGIGRSVDYGANDDYVAITHDTTPYVSIYKASPVLPKTSTTIDGRRLTRVYIKTGL